MIKEILQKTNYTYSSKIASNMENCNKSKKAKIIVRNLPFKNLSENTLRKLFSEYGEIEEVKLLKKSNGKLVGCGFVQFKKVTSAAKAIYYGNQKELDGRKIVIDWALPKKTYLQKVNELSTQNKSNKIKIEDIDFEIDKTSDSWKSKKNTFEDEANDFKLKNINNDFDNETSDHEFKNEDSDSEIETSDHNVENKISDSENETSDFGDSDLEDKTDIKKTNKINLKPFVRPSDAEDGKTVFIRNLPFSVTNENLKESFKAYGDIEYALICIDKLTEHSKGTGFVKFKTADSASSCIKDSNNIYIQESPVSVTYALTKENLESKKKDKKLPKDSRNLYLVREGVVVAGSKAAVGVSASDMSKRLQLEQWKTQMLKNLNMFVSKTRLVIHNLPSWYDDLKLKQLFMKYSNPKAIIKEAKVMWEKNNFDSKGKHISKEVGFVSFDNHEDALTALRNINNNPKIFTSNKRPIVAFSIESKAAINRKMKRVDKNKAKIESFGSDEKISGLNRKQRRFLRRRDKFIERRKALKKERECLKMEENDKNIVNHKNKRKNESNESEAKKKPKMSKEDNEKNDLEFREFTGITSDPSKKVKFRSRFNLKKQASVHQSTLKKEKFKKKLREKKRLEPTKQARQKKGKPKLLDDTNLAKLISKHRQNIENASAVKKWYEK